MRQARNGDLWFGSNGAGVYRHDGERLVQYTRTDGLRGDQVRGIEEDGRGHVLVSTTAGVSVFDGTSWRALEVEAPADGDGWVLDPDDVWLVADPGSGGPCRYDGERLLRLELPKSPAEDAFRARYPNTSYSPDGVYSVYRDRRGHLWFGTAAVGLCRYDGRNISWLYEERLTTTPGGGAFGIRSIHEDRTGAFWICNSRQRFRFSGESTRDGEYRLVDYTKEEGLPDAASDTGANFVYFFALAEDDDGALWMACGDDGVWRVDGEEVTRHRLRDGGFAVGLTLDHEGRIWAGTLEHGVHLFDGEAFRPFELP
jgi:ligand-binding sensor domain-containing protein